MPHRQDRAGPVRESGGPAAEQSGCAGALGVLDVLTDALDPYATDLGRLRADEALPERVRHRRTP